MSSAELLNNEFGSESEDDNDFNPAPADVSDREDSDDEEHPRRSKVDEKTRRRGGSEAGAVGADVSSKQSDDRNGGVKEDVDGDGDGDNEDEQGTADGDNEGDEDGGGDDDDEDDEEDDEDEDDEEAMGHRRKRRRERRNGLRTFIDVEAEVDEDEDELEEEDDHFAREADGFIDPDDLTDLPAGGETDDRRHRQLDRQREREAGLDAEKQAEVFKQRYGRSRAPTAADAVAVPKRLLLPSVEDPSIWGVKCKQGKEREIIFGIMKRVEERMGTKMQLSITSAFERGGTMAGYIYVEARKQSDIITALEGLSNVYPRPGNIVLVPIKEMPDLLRTTKTKALEPGAYVRIKRGKYQGDLAQIDAVETNGLEVLLRIIPRLDYGLNEDANAPEQEVHPASKRKRTGGNVVKLRPPQRLFSEVEARKKHSKYLQRVRTGDKTHWTYLGDDYDNGYLMKDFKIQHLHTENVDPKLEEVTLFASGGEDGTENLDLNALAASFKESNANASYLPGDMVEVYDGEQQGVCGRAERVSGNIVALRVTEGELRGQVIEAPVKSLRKRFREGDHVKVIGGSRFRDEIGMVVRISQDRVTILSDTSFQELTVFSKDLREASDSGTSSATSLYRLHDLVQLDPSTVACVIKVDRESVRMVDQNGSVRTVLPSQISNTLTGRRNVVATDRNGSEIRTDDTVREIGGEQKRGVILHIYRTYAFLHNREQTENAGVFVVRTNNLATIAAKGGRSVNKGPDLTKMNPEVQTNGGGMNPPALPQKSFGGRDRALGKTVTIRKGPYKGLLGIVKDTTDTEARVELHTKAKTITVPKDTLGFKDPLTGTHMDYSTFSGPGRGGSVMGNATPSRVPGSWEGRRTPMGVSISDSRTPAWGAAGRIPKSYQDQRPDSFGGRTPAYGNEGGRTVNPYFEGGGRTVNPYADGSRTAYGGGNKTPAWNPGSRTPYGASDAWNAGSKTPGYSGDSWGAKTPAYSGVDSWGAQSNTDNWAGGSRTSYEVATPGADVSAPTPGAMNAPTPGGYSAPTPAASAPTPRPGPAWAGSSNAGWGESAPTPAAQSAPTPGASHGGYQPPVAGKGGAAGRPGYYDAPTPAGYNNPQTPGGAEEGDEPRYSTPSP
ncbi:MAG: transcription elongation factor spt5 [Geoglossum simile]|nr:MAG: transcription elongation factor spt5 [Geoglossum simile]